MSGGQGQTTEQGASRMTKPKSHPESSDDDGGESLFARKRSLGSFAIRTLTWAAGVASLLVFVVVALASARYAYRFFGSWLGNNSGQDDWASFSTALMPMLQTLLGVATLMVAIYIGSEINAQLEERRRLDERSRIKAADQASRNRELLRLSEMLVNVEFYTKVTYPAWEVALKWLGWEGERGDRYRAQVVAGEVDLPVKAFLIHPEFSYFVREHHHNHPYDAVDDPARSCGLRELPESLAFATWIRFWRHVKFLVDEQFLDAEGVRQLLKEWYVWWAPFMAEYLEVTMRCLKALDQPADKYCALVKVSQLHTEVFGIPIDKRRPGSLAFEPKVTEIVGRILPHLKEGLVAPYADEAASEGATAPGS
jgi:hypothetical protein